MSNANMRGLTTFITDIRHCKSKDQEVARVEKELGKIRGKFTQQKGLSGYQRKKYIWKLLYMYILGYEIDFGHFEAATLINTAKFSEKYTGYIAVGTLVSEKNEDLYKTITHSIKEDLVGQNEINCSLALAMIGSLAPRELVENLDKYIVNIAFTEGRAISQFARKKAILTLLRMFRKYPERYDPISWVQPICKIFEKKAIPGLTMACSSLVLGISSIIPPLPFQEIVPRVVQILRNLVEKRDVQQEYLYYHTPNPWLQVKLLKLLQLFPPPQDKDTHKVLIDILKRIIKKTEVTKSINKNNTDHGILFEATSLIIHYGSELSENLQGEVLKLLGIFISVREPNLKYLGLETMCKLCASREVNIEHYSSTILKCLKMNDISIKRRALDLLYLMCNQNIAQKIVEELLAYTEEWADLQIKEELVLKIAILAEKYADNLIWYVDVVVRLVQSSGDYVTDDIWHRIVQMIIGFGKEANPSLQSYAANKLFSCLSLQHVQETLVMIGSFVVAEFATNLVEAGKDPQKIFDVLNRHFQQSSEKARCIILNSFAKLATSFPDLKDQVQMIFMVSSEHFDPDLQQRGIEYNALLDESEEIAKNVFSRQPPYPEEMQNQNPILKRMYKLKLTGTQASKDPTVQREAEKLAQETVKSMISTGGGGNLLASVSSSLHQTLSSNQSPNEVQRSVLHSKRLKEHELYAQAKEKILLDGACVLTPPSERLLDGRENRIELKGLFTQPVGVVYQRANELTVQYKSEFNEHMGRIAMQFESQRGAMEKISLMVTNAEGQNGVDFNISPANTQGPHPVIVIQVMSISPVIYLPTCVVFYEIQGEKKKIEFSLPILQNKFVLPVDMPEHIFNKFYSDYSNPNDSTFHKLDDFIPNPAPLNVPISEVLKKAGGLISTVLNLKVNGHPDMTNLRFLNATGQFIFKDLTDESQQAQQVKYPIVLQLEGYDNARSHLRISLRGPGSPAIIRSLYQLLLVFFSKD